LGFRWRASDVILGKGGQCGRKSPKKAKRLRKIPSELAVTPLESLVGKRLKRESYFEKGGEQEVRVMDHLLSGF